VLQKWDNAYAIEQQQMPQSAGDSALTRTTLEKIIKEALPMGSIRVEKGAIDIICHLANCFIDLISDIANNVCSQ
jgi:histone H3/H4